MRVKLPIVLFVVTVVFCVLGWGAVSNVADEMEHSIQHLLGSLDHDHHSQVSFDFEDEERFNFHFVPRERQGLALKSLTPAQRKLAHALLTTALERRGVQTVNEIMYLEQILWEMEGRNPIRDPDGYFISIFGKPGAPSWGWRFEGHHLSLNFTVHAGEVVSASPAFFGSNPGEVRQGPHQGLRVLGDREDLGRQLLLSLDEGLRTRAIVSARAPRDILSGALRRAELDVPEGVRVGDMAPVSRKILEELLEVYAGQFRHELAESLFWSRVRSAGIENLSFAWAGETQPGEGHYYRIRGASFLIEYDNTQSGANHIHSVWRDLEADFGPDPLLEHYRESHQHQ